MKELNGFELYNRLVAIDKKLKVCFMSALHFRKHEEFQKIHTKMPPDCYFEKPFDIHSISKIIHRELVKNNCHS
jgi:two-component SAPR family response regulator